MLQEKVVKYDAGVIVGRFQVARLHDEHKKLIQSVLDRTGNVIIFLGLSPVLTTRNNPLDFATRKAMILEAFPMVDVHYIKDVPSDEAWSKYLDKMIRDIVPVTNSVALFGSRDSFIAHYKGIFPCVQLEPEAFTSGTEQREQLSKLSRKSEDFRAGVVYAAYNSYPISYQTVDIAVIKFDPEERRDKLLLARKPHETAYRFPGGFVDPTDGSLEEAAARELSEECGHIVTHGVEGFKYLGSVRIDDWRYRNERDKICSAFFLAKYGMGAPKPGDDIEECRWFDLERDVTMGIDLMEAHHPLMDMLLKHMGWSRVEDGWLPPRRKKS